MSRQKYAVSVSSLKILCFVESSHNNPRKLPDIHDVPYDTPTTTANAPTHAAPPPPVSERIIEDEEDEVYGNLKKDSGTGECTF